MNEKNINMLSLEELAQVTGGAEYVPGSEDPAMGRKSLSAIRKEYDAVLNGQGSKPQILALRVAIQANFSYFTPAEKAAAENLLDELAVRMNFHGSKSTQAGISSFLK